MTILVPFAVAAALAPLTPNGWGLVKMGMTRQQVESALHVRLEGGPIGDEKSCIEMVPAGRNQGLWFMFENYRRTRISIGQPSRVTTPRGIGIGSSAAEVRRAYGRGLKAEPHKYEDLPSEYLTYWTVPDKRGVRFETDRERRVQMIHAGTSSIQYIKAVRNHRGGNCGAFGTTHRRCERHST